MLNSVKFENFSIFKLDLVSFGIVVSTSYYPGTCQKVLCGGGVHIWSKP